jgi:hypothetical protein
MNKFQQSLVLTRIMTSGVVMSIEKNDRQLPALETLVRNKVDRPFVALFNSVTGAIHGAVHGQHIGYGDRIGLAQPSSREQRFLTWLGISIEAVNATSRSYGLSEVDWSGDRTTFEQAVAALRQDEVQVYDFTGLGFGPCAALATNNESIWKRSERLKIFGAFDLRTMWSQAESEPEIQPTIQFNYRLSPLVAACVQQAILGI